MQGVLLFPAVTVVYHCYTLFFKEGILLSPPLLPPPTPTHVSWFFWNADLEFPLEQALLQKGLVTGYAGWKYLANSNPSSERKQFWKQGTVKLFETVLKVWNFLWNLFSYQFWITKLHLLKTEQICQWNYLAFGRFWFQLTPFFLNHFI